MSTSSVMMESATRTWSDQRPDNGSALNCRGFKAYKQIVKLQFRMGKHDDMLESYRQAHLACLPKCVCWESHHHFLPGSDYLVISLGRCWNMRLVLLLVTRQRRSSTAYWTSCQRVRTSSYCKSFMKRRCSQKKAATMSVFGSKPISSCVTCGSRVETLCH